MTTNPKRSEVWLVSLDPTIGAEIRKTRLVVIISSDFVGKLPLKIVVPITDWKTTFDSDLWHIRLDPSAENGLTKISAVDALQVRSINIRRFIRKLGIVPIADLQEITSAIAAIIEHQELVEGKGNLSLTFHYLLPCPI
jgi:mRNA interferase MazF